MLTVHGVVDTESIPPLENWSDPETASNTTHPQRGENRSVTSREQLKESVMEENSLRTARGCLTAQ